MSNAAITTNNVSGLPEEIHVYRFPRWKWPIVRQCFPGRRVIFLTQAAAVPAHACLVLWGMAPVPDNLSGQMQLIRMEDGFLRSVGLGADLVRPLSWIMDKRGVYYDATRPSDLEVLLQTGVGDESMLVRASALRLQIVAGGLTKYNVDTALWHRPANVGRVILVPGQVESDASLAFGRPVVATNLGLLRMVRKANPEAHVIYKPHPDVVARLRAQGKQEQEVNLWCDEVVTSATMGDLLMAVDEVHVMTSLAGFEALLRDKPVTCYGQPFYSGWGLTTDLVTNSRRTRLLTIDELVAGVLIKYPVYLSRDGKRLLTPELALDELLRWRERAGTATPWWRNIVRIFLRLIIGVR